jgi:hypothetical protein
MLLGDTALPVRVSRTAGAGTPETIPGALLAVLAAVLPLSGGLITVGSESGTPWRRQQRHRTDQPGRRRPRTSTVDQGGPTARTA